MGWSGSLTAGSALGSAITFTPDTTTMGGYTVSSFTAPKRGIYKFTLKGSGGASGNSERAGRADGGAGGLTTGYLLLESGAKVYVGAGGTCSAAFVSSSTGTTLSAVTQANLYFVAGAGGQGGASGGSYHWVSAGGAGGGTTGAAGETYQNGVGTTTYTGGGGGTQTGGGSGGVLPSSEYLGGAGNKGAYGVGGGSVYYNYYDISADSGRGGDGYYGGGSGGASNIDTWTGCALGGGGGSGYVRTASLSVAGKTYTSVTQQGGGAAAGARGSVVVTYYALAELPVRFDGTQLTKLIFNGTEVKSLIYNGQTIFARRLKACLRYLAGRFGFPEGTPA